MLQDSAIAPNAKLAFLHATKLATGSPARVARSACFQILQPRQRVVPSVSGPADPMGYSPHSARSQQAVNLWG
jgi:hypothetical protein